MHKQVNIDPSAGFCFGVENAIKIAEQHLKKGDKVFGLGHMVHNEAEIDRLDALGMKTIGPSDFKKLKSEKVVFRAHGEPPQTYELARKHNINVIDATCPIVSRLQKKISKRYLKLDHRKEQIVIYGKTDHPETIGLLGQTNGDAILVTDPNELSGIDMTKKIYLYSQTTMDPESFTILEANIRKHSRLKTESDFIPDCTICGQMKKRKPELKKFATNHELIVFLSGKKSSNGEMLFQYCKKQNSRTYWIHAAEDIDPDWFKNIKLIGVSGATSTPAWHLQEIRDYIESLIKE